MKISTNHINDLKCPLCEKYTPSGKKLIVKCSYCGFNIFNYGFYPIEIKELKK